MQEVTDGKINCIIVRDLSRFGREFSETGRFLKKVLPAYGVRFISILDEIDTDKTPIQDDLIVQIKTLINDEFSRELSVKTRSALRSMRERGLYVGSCPIYGYQKLDEHRNQLLIDEYAASIVREIFRMKIAGFSAAAIADKLNEHCVLSPLEYKRHLQLSVPKRGYADKLNAKWSATTAFRILKDETYTGTLVQGKQYTPNYKIKKQFTKPKEKWIRVEKTHEAIISKYDFETVQRLMLLDTRSSPGENTVNLFSGILKCGCCNGNMTRKTCVYNGKATRYYYCPKGKKHGCSSPASIREDVLISYVSKKIKNYISKLSAHLQHLSQMSTDDMNLELTKNLTKEIEDLQNQLDQKTFFKSKLSSALMNGLISGNDYDHMKKEYSKEIIELEEKIDAKIRKVRSIMLYSDEYVYWLNEICQYADIHDFDRALAARVIKSIQIESEQDVSLEFEHKIIYPANHNL